MIFNFKNHTLCTRKQLHFSLLLKPEALNLKPRTQMPSTSTLLAISLNKVLCQLDIYPPTLATKWHNEVQIGHISFNFFGIAYIIILPIIIRPRLDYLRMQQISK